jgi:hypothetical protein
MKLLSCIIFLFSFMAAVIEQYQTDTTIKYNRNISHYTFDFDGGEQGFYLGENVETELREAFLLFFKNSSHDEIIIEKMNEGNETVKFKTNMDLPSVVKPQDSIRVVGWIQSHADHIDVPLKIYYKRNGIQDTLHIPIWQNKVRTNKLRIYFKGRDISRTCKVYVTKNGDWELLDINDTISGYYFFNIRALQDSIVAVKIVSYQYGNFESEVFTSRGSDGYISLRIGDDFKDYRPVGFAMKALNVIPNTYCLMTKNGGQMKYRPEYMDSMKMILDRFSIQSFDKDKMILTINSKKTAYILDRKLRKSSLKAKLLPVSSSEQLLQDQVTIYFTSGTASEWIEKTFKELGIEKYFKSELTYHEYRAFGNAKKYVFEFEGVIGSLFQDQLKELWRMKQVKFVNHDLMRNPYLPPQVDEE